VGMFTPAIRAINYVLLKLHRTWNSVLSLSQYPASIRTPSKQDFDETPSKAKTDARTNAPPVDRWNGMRCM
jgi:hypothetical protein